MEFAVEESVMFVLNIPEVLAGTVLAMLMVPLLPRINEPVWKVKFPVVFPVKEMLPIFLFASTVTVVLTALLNVAVSPVVGTDVALPQLLNTVQSPLVAPDHVLFAP